MLDVAELFADASASPPPTALDLWTDHDTMKGWLDSVFDTILATPSREIFEVDVAPYRFVHDGRNLFSVSLLSLFSLRPHDATISKQDLQYLFCDAFLDAIEFQGDETESFAGWVATMILRIGEEEEFLDFAPADFIRDHLLYVAVHDPLLARLRMTERYNYVPLLVSGLFAIHIGGLWPQLFDRIDGRSRLPLKLPFKLIEMFLNRFAEKELRFRTVTDESVKETMKLRRHGVTHPDLAQKEATVLQALRLAQKPPSRSFVQKFGDAANALRARAIGNGWANNKVGARPAAAVSKKRARGVEKLELEDAA
ncbi:MAG: hypothetical protein ACEQSB_06295 [Undibacterium sp.]